MMLNLKDLSSPLEFWEYFEKISQIPHCSGKEDKVREFIRNEAQKFNFETKIDKAGNLLVIITPTKEIKSTVILQSHMDMVCEKNKDVLHDFSKDPLKLKIISLDDKKWMTAEGTTLGADNATGMAYSLDLVQFHDLTPHKPLLESENGTDYRTWRYSHWLKIGDSIWVYYEARNRDCTNEIRLSKV